MSLTQLLLKSIWHYRKLNLTVVLGVALSTAILLGALIIGDSVRFSLDQGTIQRLGKTSHVIVSGERLFRKQLAEEITAQEGVRTAALLRSNGVAIIEGGKSQYNQLAVWGADTTLGNFAADSQLFQLSGNEAAINENLAVLAGLKIGDEFLLRTTRLNTFPSNTPFVSAEESSVSFRVIVKSILKADQLGNFSLRNIQSSPRNVFLNLDWLNEQMKLKQKSNVILVQEGINGKNLAIKLQQYWKLEDLNLKIRENTAFNYTEIISDRVFIEPITEQVCMTQIPGCYPVFTYFINGFTFGQKESPYSFVSTNDTLTGQEMVINSWLADDLKVNINDSLRLSYFEVGPLRRLIQKDTVFIVRGITKLEDRTADRDLMPVIPGLSDAGNCRDWKTGVPVDLQKIRPEDEAYWKQFKGTPKGFVSLQTARNLWGNRFGQETAIRMEGLNGPMLGQTLLRGTNPSQVGFEITDAKTEGMSAAANGVDFGELFIGLSFFVLVAAFLLASLLFRLFLNYRKSENQTLRAIGFSFGTIRKMLFFEAMTLVVMGIILGIPLSIGYNNLILGAINTIWNDIVRTSIASVHLRPLSIVAGTLVISIIFAGIFFSSLNKFLADHEVRLPKQKMRKKQHRGRISLITGLFLVFLSLGIALFFGINKGEINTDLFFVSGFGLLPGLIFLFNFSLVRIATGTGTQPFSLKSLIIKRLSGERKRTLMAVGFLSIGIFLVIATGLYRKDLSANAAKPFSGTGGYEYFIETTLPVLFDAGSPAGKTDLGLPLSSQVVSFLAQPGDDASCLNLNRISRPRLLACNPAQFDENSAFSFATRTEDLDEKHPWQSLNKRLAGNVIPAFADQSVIQWSLGKKIGDTLLYKNEAGDQLKLKLIGGFENSVFQGNIIVSEEVFVKAFPTVSGATVFLVNDPENTINYDDFKSEWRRFGSEITGTTDRLQNFNRIENTYLNIFLMLGALGLLIGTAGLGIIIFRTTFEQIPEYALLLSVGFEKSFIVRMLYTEKLLMILAAVLTGAIPATVSAIPVLLSQHQSNLWIWLPAVTLLVLVSGYISVSMAVRLALKNNLIRSLLTD
jgi:hypothetical protein